MINRLLKSTFLFFLIGILSCTNTNKKAENTSGLSSEKPSVKAMDTSEIILAANRTEEYFPLLKGKKLAFTGNQTSLIKTENGDYKHVVDSLISAGIDVKKVFAPEHGFRGDADAGETVKDGVDTKTGLPIISLYGSNKKPSAAQLKGIDVMIFDIQDVGARFYTYLSTLHYLMEACAENDIPLIVLDRPNPNADYIDGPILRPEFKSFVGMHPVPVVYGMTIGEYAQMINGEGWLENGKKCDLTVINLKNYDHSKPYSLPVKPSPNLPNDLAINLYPSLCFFEGTNVNAGRGTNTQFQVFGSPSLDSTYFDYSYVPQPMAGAQHPKHEGEKCYGRDLTDHEKLEKLNLEWLLEAYEHSENKADFFNSFFEKLAGTDMLRKQVKEGLSAEAIQKSWQAGLEAFKNMRKKYLLYQ
ncbi:DUF1343 domain-containing protein [Christiangramia fulva]|uniref:DUF1343 domain-containing protein n=1 Tax=Christiangramia fulva TaxID=2126553 RepID=A0A2R3Z629_9FLAO|nr:DUF1343 domain-containing protein [Christiangramia fulva]AVR45731.1 DUF1343 domain-containing protein [Christiangramia fulva]